MLSENENDLLLEWFMDISTKHEGYKEPILDKDSIRLFKQITDILEQSPHVFVLSIEVAEDYIRVKNSKNQKIGDPLLAAVTIAFICHKCEGAPETLKIKHVQDLLYYFSRERYSYSDVTSMEGEILVTLKGKLPVTTSLDDLDIIIERYIRESRLRANVRPLCLKILEYVYMERMKWFEELKGIYSENKDCMVVFQNLFSSKLFFPVCIFVAALKMTHYRHILDIDAMITDITKNSRIHPDHLAVLINKIMEVIS